MKRGPVTDAAFHPDFPFMCRYNFTSNRESQAHAAGCAAGHLEVILENLLMILRWNARTVVGDRKAHAVCIGVLFLLPAFLRNADRRHAPLPKMQIEHHRHTASLGSILQSILAEIVEDVLEFTAIAPHTRKLARRRVLELNAARLPEFLPILRRFRH